MDDEDPTMRGWQLLQQALVAWDGFGQAAAAKADATESRVVAVQLEDTDTQKNIDELLARIKAGKRESGPPQR
jgi:hypothetical protein